MGRSSCFSKEGFHRGAWTAEQDMILSEYIRIHGDGGWRDISIKTGLKRRGKSCRLRWMNYLRPDIKRGNISPDEEELIIRMHRLLGNRWSLIAGRLPGRTDNEIKNYWNTHLSKKLLMNKSHCISSTQNPKTGSKYPALQQNHVFKTRPLKITTAVTEAEMIRRNGCSKSSKSQCNLLLRYPMADDDSEHIPFANMADVNLVETEIKSSSCSMSDQQCPHSDHFAGEAATLSQSLLYLNELPSTPWNLPFCPSHCSIDFGFEELYREPATMAAATNEFEDIPATMAAGTNEFEDIFSDQRNTQPVNSFRVVDHHQRMEDFCDNPHHKEWTLDPNNF